MKKIKALISIILILFISMQYISAQTNLGREQSDPKLNGWMQGFPPPQNKVILAADGSFFNFPAMRYSICHIREFMPTKTVRASDRPITLPHSIDNNIDEIKFFTSDENKEMTWQESLDHNYVDGIVILHKGKVVYERYMGELEPDGEHAVMSVSKTFAGTLGAMLVEEGTLDENKTAAEYVPELKNSAFGDATVRQILDMTTSLSYSEDYANPKAEVWEFSSAGNPFPKPEGYTGAKNFYEYLQKVKKDKEHGVAFGYKTVNTDALGWIISRQTGKGIPELLSEKIWKPLGCKYDAYYQIDASGIAFAGGGLSANLLDLAKFGEMIRNKGYFNGKQIIPLKVVEDIFAGGNKEAFAKAGYKTLGG